MRSKRAAHRRQLATDITTNNLVDIKIGFGLPPTVNSEEKNAAGYVESDLSKTAWRAMSIVTDFEAGGGGGRGAVAAVAAVAAAAAAAAAAAIVAVTVEAMFGGGGQD